MFCSEVGAGIHPHPGMSRMYFFYKNYSRILRRIRRMLRLCKQRSPLRRWTQFQQESQRLRLGSECRLRCLNIPAKQGLLLDFPFIALTCRPTVNKRLFVFSHRFNFAENEQCAILISGRELVANFLTRSFIWVVSLD